ncbi:MAG TPA: hypothetical protein DCG12_12325, partial [Planctomycetaceae bacterium]|nr:hypothetical protein [Planctomycetaceae bacterium]
TALDPVVVRKLQHFARRRRRLIVARGLFSGIATFVVCMAIVAAIDWYWLLSDSTRWSLSAGAYSIVALVVWWTSVRRLFKSPDREEIAARVELAEPELREQLLSAVELATDDPSAINDSPVFRSLLQGEVAQQMVEVRVGRLLPLKLIGRWALAALVFAGIAAALWMSDDPRFQQLARRAMMPGANIARVSRIQIEVLEPTPSSLTMAEDETVAVLVGISGGDVSEVTLETRTPENGTVRQSMRPKEASEYLANIHVSNEDVEYRVFAGDAITKRYTIQSRPRPRVVEFQKTFEYPEYSRLQKETVADTNGDLRILEGTTVQLACRLDQQVSQAELRIDPIDSDEIQTIPLKRIGKGSDAVWGADVPVTQDAVYRVHLVSRETGFDNPFSPKYEISPLPDLVPRAGFVDQQESSLLLPPNDILALKGMAEDDLPVETLEQQISVNGSEWQTVSLETSNTDQEGRTVTAAWDWDLVGHDLQVGDQVTTRLVATDRKGNQGESIPIRIIVAAADFDPERHALMDYKFGVYDHLKELADIAEQNKTSALELIEQLRKQEGTEQQQAAHRVALLEMASRVREESASVLREIRRVEKVMPPGADAADLDLTGRVIARIRRDHGQSPDWHMQQLGEAKDEAARQNILNGLKYAYERMADDAKSASIHYQALATHNFVAAVADDLTAMKRQQELIVNSPTQTWVRLLRQETLIINQLDALEKLLQAHKDRLAAGNNTHVDQLLTWLTTHRDRLNAGTESEDKLPELKAASVQIYNELKAKDRYEITDGSLPARVVGARRDFQNRSGTLYDPIYQLSNSVRQETNLARQAADAADLDQGLDLRKQADQFLAETTSKRRPGVDQLRERRSLTQSRRDADAQYAADAGLTHRATTGLLNQHQATKPQESKVADHLMEIAPAYRVLEAGHAVVELQHAIRALLSQERWDAQKLEGRTDNPRQWEFVSNGLLNAAAMLRAAKVDNEIVAKIDQLRSSPAHRDAQQRITERRWRRDIVIGAGHEVEEIRDGIDRVAEELKPVMAEARAVIAKYAPTIPEMARAAAESVRRLEDETTQAADEVEQSDSPEQADEQVAQLEQQREAVNEQLEDLFEALVEDANSQDILDEEELERARDADDSIALVQKPAAEMNQALDAAKQADDQQQQANELSRSAEEQEKTAQALELIAEHFEKLDAGEDVAETREELRATEQQQGIAAEMNQQFENAHELAEMAQTDTEDLIAELEEELKQNPAMQEALSEISRNTLEEAKAALENAAVEDERLQQSNEQSDQEFVQKKKDLAEELRQLGQEAQKLSNELVAQANQAAARGKTPEAQKKLAETQQKLNQAAAKANASRETQPLEDLQQTANEAAERIAEATAALDEAKKQTETGKDQKIHADEKARQAAKQASEEQRKAFVEAQKRNMANEQREADLRKRQAEQQVRVAENQQKAAQRRIDAAKRNLARQPDNPSLKAAVAREEARKQEVEDKRVAETKAVEKQRVAEAEAVKQKNEEINKSATAPLNAPNPATELADEFAEKAQEVAKQLNEKAQGLKSKSDFGDELTPSQGQLAAAEQKQQEVTQDVKQTAEDVARAARHERRLNNEAAAEPIQQVAENIQQAADNESQTAQNQLNEAAAEAMANAQAEAQAAQQTQANNQNQGEQPAQGGMPDSGMPQDEGPNNQQAQEAQQALANAEDTFRQEAENLSEAIEPLLAAAEAQAQAQQTREPQNGEP